MDDLDVPAFKVYDTEITIPNFIFKLGSNITIR